MAIDEQRQRGSLRGRQMAARVMRRMRRTRLARLDGPPESSEDRKENRLVLLAALPKGAVCAEVGVWKGDNAETLLGATDPRKLYLIDPWRHGSDSDLRRAMYGQADQLEMDSIHDAVIGRFAGEIDAGRVEVLRITSTEAARRFEPASLDWAYIDGDHREAGVRRDLELYSSLVRPGGYLAGDDYGVRGWWEHGVTKAVDRFRKSDRCRDFQRWGSQFLIRLAG
jgi:hypothetical protein